MQVLQNLVAESIAPDWMACCDWCSQGQLQEFSDDVHSWQDAVLRGICNML